MNFDDLKDREEHILQEFLTETNLELSALSVRRIQRLKEVIHAIAEQQEKREKLLAEIKTTSVNITNIAKKLNLPRCSLQTNEQAKLIIKMYADRQENEENSQTIRALRNRNKTLEDTLKNIIASQAEECFFRHENEQLKKENDRLQQIIKTQGEQIAAFKKNKLKFTLVSPANENDSTGH